ncbi:MAG: hypothetical protein INR71_05175, partial [Terriglobus roseus]|nr:hypothetical protein [Terriglobus roseus]
MLRSALKRHEDAYAKLDRTKQGLHRTVRLNRNHSASQLAELEQVCASADKPLKRVLHHLRGNALTFSGGGIRSASFCLGVLQGLARFSLGGRDHTQITSSAGLLQDTQYISTVSGGGYLGCWFSSWVARLAAPTGTADTRSATERFQQAYDTTLRGLAGELPRTGGDPAPEVIRHLREYTAYLAPQLGLSLDVWALLAITTRNLLINWLMLVPLMLIMVTVPSFLIFGIREFHDILSSLTAFARSAEGVLPAALAHSAFYISLSVLVLVSAIASGRSLPSYRPWSGAPAPTQQASGSLHVFLRFVLPLLTVAFLLAAHFYPVPVPPASHVLEAMAFAAVAALGFGVLGIFKWWTHYATYPGGRIAGTAPIRPYIAAVLMFLVTLLLGVATGITLELLGSRLLPLICGLQPKWLESGIGPVFYGVFALPLFVVILLLGATLFSALTQMLESENDREWWARAGGLLMASGFVWLISAAVVFLGTAKFTHWHWAAVPMTGGTIGLITSIIAKSSSTSSGARPDQASARRFSLNSLVLPLLAILSVALLAAGLARFSEEVRTHLGSDFLGDHPAVADLFLLIVYAALAAGVNRVVNLNVFSLHGLYRERLMRAFLGASNPARHADPFIGFDSSDTLLMQQLAHTPGAPLHIVNTTLNLVGTRRAAWRQRKAESFTFSSISAGAWRLNYVAADAYGGTHGVSVATAMAISGAAADPNMGYHSSPLVGLLMTIFNVRLGWWLPNPGYPGQHGYTIQQQRRFLRRSGPVFSVSPLLEELFGLTDDTRSYVELSDGGHFENLGLYEMVMRRCRNIIVVDSGADATFTFEDLGNALRKIEIDLGIPIHFDQPPSMRAGKKSMAHVKNRYCAVATIRYSCVDDDIYRDTSPDGTVQQFSKPDSTRDGTLLYIKACLNGAEPMDVTEYARSHSDFPHESTTNQFFNEAQFESHRSLGSHVIETIMQKSAGA